MEYTRIVAVTGMPGLYEVLSSKSDGAVVRSLEDQTTKFVSARIHNLSHLESIEVYTTRENVGLSDVFAAMKENQTDLPDPKDNKAVKAYFEKVYPDLDFERVYASDMKKMVQWFKVLQQNNVDFSQKEEAEQPTPEPVAETATAPETSATEESAKPKKTRKKKTEE